MRMSINETRRIIDITKKILSEGYLSAPNRDGTFDDKRHLPSRNIDTSVFQTQPISDNQMSFRLIDDPKVIARVLGLVHSYIPDDTVADYQNGLPQSTTRGIKVVDDGMLQKYGDKWEVKKKMVIQWT